MNPNPMKSLALSLLFAAVSMNAALAQQAPRQKLQLKTLADGSQVIANELKVTLREGAARTLSLDGKGKAKAVGRAGLLGLNAHILAIESRHTCSKRWMDGDSLPEHLRRADGKIPRIARNFAVILRPGADVEAVRAALRLLPQVERVDFKPVGTLDSIPNDTQYGAQWAPAITGLQDAWDVPGRGRVRVAVIDTGVDLAHPEFAGRVVYHRGFSDFSTGQSPSAGANFDHGTHVAGIIAAARNNNQGVAGYSNDIDLMVLNCAAWVTDPNRYVVTNSDDAIDDAVANGAKVINCSFGFDSSVEDEVEDAHSAGVLVVHSAGNNATTIADQWESGSDALFTISSTMQSGMPATDTFDASYSNFGPGIDLAAPGTGIFSTLPGNYGLKSGTSMAAPQVSGAAALMMSMNPDGLLSHRAVRHLLIRMAQDKGAPGYDEQYGYGVLRLQKNVYQACRDATAFVKSANTPTILTFGFGTYEIPWRTLDEALANVPNGATLVLNGGVTYPPNLQIGVYTYPVPAQEITKPCVLTAIPDRPVVIGVP